MNLTLKLPRLWAEIKRTTRGSAKGKAQFQIRSQQLFRGLLSFAVIALLTYLSPFQRPHGISELRLGSVAPERINAPFLFLVRKANEELELERSEAEKTIPTILRLEQSIREKQLAYFDSVLAIMLPNSRMEMREALKKRRLQRQIPEIIGSLSETSLEKLIETIATTPPDSIDLLQRSWFQLLADVYSTGVIESKKGGITSNTDQVRIGDTPFAIEQLHSENDLKRGELTSLINAYHPFEKPGLSEAAHELLSLFVRPNLSVDRMETSRLRSEARRSVASIKRRYLRDEMIIDKNQKIEQDHIDAMEALAEHFAHEELKNPTTRYLQAISGAIIAIFLLLTLGYYLATREPKIYNSHAQLILITVISMATVTIAAYIQANEIPAYFVPTPMAAMLMTILLRPQVGLIVSFLLALYIGSLFGDFYITLIFALTSAVSVYGVRRVRHRNQFYRVMVLLPTSYCLLIAATDLLRFVPIDEIYQHILPGIFIGIAAPIVIQGLLPIFESLFHITTDITLLELSDLNRPLLRELAIRAPGTYTHSLIMANLSEAAGQAIGANPLLARVGCYYHDIGKMSKPEYFTENQGLREGKNPHDHLTPSMSMLIIDSHVKDGIELAEQHGLPKALIDLIPQHHGTTVQEYFFNRAVKLGGKNVRREDFRYDGPKPQTKEAGILMLADSVESAVRTLNERTHNRARQLVRNIIQQKFTIGELDECPLTLRELHRIEESFIPVLMGTLHGRLEYPWQTKREDQINNRNAPNTVPTQRT